MQHVRVLTALLCALGQSCALAQAGEPAAQVQGAAKNSSSKVPMIHRWVDAHGRVHYSDAAPPANARSETVFTPVPDTEQRALPNPQNTPRQTQPLPPANMAASEAAPGVAAHASESQETGSEHMDESQGNACSEQWARFDAAAQCANQYRVVGGGLKQDVARNCPVLPEPQCPRP